MPLIDRRNNNGTPPARPSPTSTRASTPPAPAAPSAPAVLPAGPAPVAFEPLRAACGHVVPFALYQKDPTRDGRRAKEAARKCPACRQRDAEERQRQEMAAAAERRARDPRPMLTRSQRIARGKSCTRLPDGSEFVVRYDAGTETWSGALAVSVDGVERTFSGSAGALFVLLSQLDQQYREALLITTGQVAKPK